MGFRLPAIFARIYIFPFHIILTEFPKEQPVTWHLEAARKRAGVFVVVQCISDTSGMLSLNKNVLLPLKNSHITEISVIFCV